MSATNYEMRLFVFLLLCCLLESVISRPPAETYKDAEEEYEDEGESALEDASREDESVAVDEKVSNNREDDDGAHVRQNRNYYFKHGQDRTPIDESGTKEGTNDNFSELNSDRRLGSQGDQADNDQDEPETNNGRENYSETDSQNSQFTQESANLEAKGISRDQQISKARSTAEEAENNDVIYENSDINQGNSNNFDKNKNNYDTAEPNVQSYFYNHYYNRPQAKNRESESNAHEDINQDDSNRNRRGAGDPTDVGNNQDIKDKDFKNFETEAEQAIIQRYIKKLNKKEVDELFSTLSDEKKALLEHIINNGEVNRAINLNKREITKKAGAVEDNNLLDGVQSDANSISGPPINLNIGDTLFSNNGVTAITTALDQHLSKAKTDDNISKRSIIPNEEVITEKLETTLTTSTESTTAKSDNKREVNFKDFNNEECPGNALKTNEAAEEAVSDLQDESYSGPQDEDLSQLMNDEEQLHDYHNPQKRDILEENNSDLAESLQESFSNSKAYEDMGCDSGADMLPLIRVKRKNKHAVKKRAAAILPESNVAYVPESEGTDNEGDELYEDSFFERSPTFAESDAENNKASSSRQKTVNLNNEANQNVYQRSNSPTNVVAKDTVNIGSDTDRVLDRVEGVDENLMYKGGRRRKRAAENNLPFEPANKICNNDTSTHLLRESAANNNTRPQNYGIIYKDNEGFGELSKSYEEIGRYKRIRRHKATNN